MVGYVMGAACALLVLAVWTLGVDVSGRGTPTGNWADTATPQNWAMFLVATALLGLLLGRRLERRLAQVLAVSPTLVLLGHGLWGPLGPIPWVIYLCPTIAVWFAGLAAGRMLRARLARTVKP